MSIRRLLLLLALMPCFAWCLALGLGAAERKPNVIIIFTDDQGSIDAGCYGANDLETPGIDTLALRGVRFTQFYAAAPVCSPSRAGLLTGRYPLRAGMPGNAGSTRGHAGLSPEEVTIAEMLKTAGYTTAQIGKWHLGYTPETMPNGQGFDHSFGHMGGCIDNFSHFFYWAGPNRHDLWRNGEEIFEDGTFFPDLMVEEAAAFMKKNKDRPFFIYFAMNAPHYPYQGEPRWRRHYSKLKYPRNLYNAFVTTLDARIKRVIGAVDDLGLREQTIIIFQSDHGHSVEVRAHQGGGNNGPYRGHKFTMFEGGLRVPAIISWPGHLPQNQVRGQIAHSCDWLPTIAELCGVKVLNPDIDGKSMVKIIRSPAARTPHEVVHWQTGKGPKARWAVRHGPWKLIGNADSTSDGPPLSKNDRRRFLVNLDINVSESKNLAGQQPEVLRRLQKLRDDWIAAQ